MSKLFSLSLVLALSLGGIFAQGKATKNHAVLNEALLKSLKEYGAYNTDLHVAKKLIAQGAHITSTDIAEVIGDALYSNDDSFVTYILSTIKTPELLNHPYHPFTEWDGYVGRQSYGMSLLSCATEQGKKDIIDLFQQKGARFFDNELKEMKGEQFEETLKNQGCDAAQKLLRQDIAPAYELSVWELATVAVK